jgi:hypoxanthine phosphoribosyltransferase
MKTVSNNFCERILVTESEIDSLTTKISKEITKDYMGKEVVFIAILNGAFMFASDLVKKVNVDCYIDFMQCSTYGDKTVSSGNFIVKKDLTMNIAGKDIIIVEDILDSGYTLKNLKQYLELKNPNSIKIATFIDKPKRRTEDICADYCGLIMDDDSFIVGYGLDYAQKYRNLPYIAVLKEEIYNK